MHWSTIKVQGLTESGQVMLHDVKSQYLKRSHLHVGLSMIISGMHRP